MQNIVAIRREDVDKRGEQRVAIIPDHLHTLSEKGCQFLVQPRTTEQHIKRVFPDDTYKEAGATLTEDLSNARVIFGLKEVNKQKLLADKTYLFFSHTHKGQIKNRPLLKKMTEQNITLIDYELILADKQRVLTAFTYFAGYAGMTDTLWALGNKWDQQGIPNPFSIIPQSIEKGNLGQIKELIHQAGNQIKEEGTPANLPPIICCFLGKGKTSTGSQEMFDLLPVKEITLEELPETYAEGNRHTVYKLVLGIADMYRLKPEAQSTYQDLDDKARAALYIKEPQHFESNLDQVFPYCTIWMNCILWSSAYPRLISYEQAKEWYASHHTLQIIGDITCDPEGAIQFSRETWIDDPIFVYDPESHTFHQDPTQGGITVMAVTNLPCEFSEDASAQFSEELMPYLPAIIFADYNADSPKSAGLPPEIVGATILWKGDLTPSYAYMEEYL